MEDEYLSAFFNDVRSIGVTISTSVQFLLGLSYVTGKYLAESAVSTCAFMWMCCIEFKSFLESLLGALVDIWTSAVHGVLLLYYGVGRTIEAFQITFLDLISFLTNMCNSFSELIVWIGNLIINALSALTIIPSQMNTTLALVGDLFMTILSQSVCLLQHFITSLIWSPFYAMSVLAKCIWTICIQIPTAVLKSSADKVTFSAAIGLGVLILFGYVYSKLSFIEIACRVLQWILFACRRGFALILMMLTSIRTKINRRNAENEDAETADNHNNGNGGKSHGLCVICQVDLVCFISSPCNHVCLCRTCVHRLVEYDSRCPICRKTVDYFSRVYIS